METTVKRSCQLLIRSWSPEADRYKVTVRLPGQVLETAICLPAGSGRDQGRGFPGRLPRVVDQSTIFFFLLVEPQGLWDLSSPARD